MGHKIKRKTYKLSFQPDTPLDGLTVVVRGLSLGRALELRRDTEQYAKGGEESEDATERLAKLLADHLVEWNAEDEDGVPIPATLDGLMSQDTELTFLIVNAWQDAVSAVASPLPQTSTDGQPSVEASIPMDVLSESLAS